ncbi:polysaccharide pyruvyl transferase family protein [Pseudosulfitobacter sp. DSM 107133]|uniref:polysaccharide pyruvyl transferase family protein n=1 Tax=Pseudosulfitobacter sp. DSM 107133 TaxID=2883100 RepID=UPI000DF121C6|nr:polysaccharide pyruvyl transferase family protein [Pseudosulfitobacter sp. DSM 107133]UOA27351.1 hypothetical protein DSM107133_02076 [Pseudosulfitobacter sp. DSM 107133]
MAAGDPIALHWWKAVPNFGDAISAMVVAHVSGRPVTHAGAGKADLFAVGSIIQVARRAHQDARADGVKPWIWGSGMLAPVNRDFLSHVQIAAVRGPVSAALLQLETDSFGDPGLLISEVVTDLPERSDRIGIVPHHTLVDAAATLAADLGYLLIDPRGVANDVCRQIASCAHIFASSLHGLIVADAYGVPNTWVAPTGQGHLKYHDYAAGVGRSLIAPLAMGDIAGFDRASAQPPQAYAQGIARARAALKSTFPAPLRAAPHMASA